MMKIKVLSLFILLFITASVKAQQPVDQPDADGRIIRGPKGSGHWRSYMANADLSNYHHASEEVAEQFKDLKYGIRIHWGVYSIVLGEASWVITNTYKSSLSFQGLYHDLYKKWYPDNFNADEWTSMMVKNGFQYFVFTTKHHDGFSMYKTGTQISSRYNYFGKDAGTIEPCNLHYSIMETPFGRDITGELIESARKKGLKIGLYFSHPDWYDADFRFDSWNPNKDKNYSPENNPESWERFKTRHNEQITELLTNYGKIDMLSLDMYLPEFAWNHMQDLARLARNLQPDCMLRWRGIGNYGDYHTPENYIPGDAENQGTMPWTVIHPLSTRGRFAYEPESYYIRGGDWIVSSLIDIVSKGGGFQVAIGPDLTGSWHPKALESLSYAADWLKVNGEAIFNTRPCKINRVNNIYYTRNKENTIIYAIIEGWPEKSTLFIDNVKADPGSKIIILGYDQPLAWKETLNGITIELPDKLFVEKNRPCKQAYAFKIFGKQIEI